jgi:hypothetical protein
MTEQDVPQANEILYSLKLVSGEELMCTVIDIKETGTMVIESPIAIRTIPIMMDDGGFENRLNTQLWMPYAATRIFTLDRVDILAYNQLHPDLHKFYVKMVNKYELPDVDTGYNLLDMEPLVKTIQ